MQTTLQSEINIILKQFPEYWENEELLKHKVIEDLRNYREELIDKLLSNDLISKTYSVQLGENKLFKLEDFVSMLRFKNYWLSSYTKYSNEIGLTNEGKYLKYNTDVVLDFPYKDTIFEGSMTKEEVGKKEIFFHNILAKEEIDVLRAPKILTNVKKIDVNGEHETVEFNDKDNLIIKGNNLIALHTLKERYAGKIKLVYMDPPYNTGNDSFKYNDRFNHSTWLTFMKNRLEIAKELLSDNGVILAQVDDNMQAHLKILMDEIFGANQFETTFHVQVRYKNKTLSEDNDFQKVMEVVHVYSKNHSSFAPNKLKEEYSLDKFKWAVKEKQPKETIIENGKKVDVFGPDDFEISEEEPHLDGLKETWATGSLIRQGGTAAEFLAKYLVDRNEIGYLYKVYGMGSDGLGFRYIRGPKRKGAQRGTFFSGVPLSIKNAVSKKEYYKEKPIPNLLNNLLHYEDSFGNNRTEGGVDIGGGKKPESLLQYFIEYFSNKDDIILDFFGGSGTTAATALKLNRRFITVEQLDNQLEKMLRRMKNVISGDKTGISKEVKWQGGDSFIYAELQKLNETYIDNIQKVSAKEELIPVVDEMKKRAYLDFRVDMSKLTLDNDNFSTLSLEKQKDILIKVLDGNQMYLSYSEIEDKLYDVPEKIKEFNRSFYESEDV